VHAKVTQNATISGADQLSESAGGNEPGAEVHAVCHIPVLCSRYERLMVNYKVEGDLRREVQARAMSA
jgi:hypothetical protein